MRAPELRGRAWLNTDGPLSLAGLRGRFVLLDFWTSCCVNCLHVIEEMRELEARYTEELVIVGVHSPKFVHEADPAALAAAVERYDVRHPVLDDPDLVTWQAYTARAWPTLVLVDPEGYVVAQLAGEGHGHAVAAMIEELLPVHRARGTVQPGDSPYVAPDLPDGDLRFPAAVLALDQGHWLVADAGHHQLVELTETEDGEWKLVRRIGAGVRGRADGSADQASFAEPNGLCVLPCDVAAEVGYDVVVADTANHLLRGVRLETGEVQTVAGTGRAWMQGDAPENQGCLSSPWDVVWWQDQVWVAMAGIHQLWTFDPRTGEAGAAAGTTHEGLVDGPSGEAWFAQTSGLAVHGDQLWLVDSETSALRCVEAGVTTSVVGRGLFDFGFTDGSASTALLQHPLGLTVLPDGSVVVADTYNGALRRWDPVAGELTTLATGLAEPSDVVLDGDTLLVVESAAHRLTRVGLGGQALADGFARTTHRPTIEVGPGTLELVVDFTPPPGQKVDERYGPASQLVVEATPPGLLRSGAGRGTSLTRTVEIDAAVGDGVLHVAARAASCDIDDQPGAACHVHQQDWGVPVRVVAGAPSQLELPLAGH